MGMNIKNEHVHALAREAAQRTGRTQTSVLELALTKLLDDLPDEAGTAERRSAAERIAVDFSSRLTDEQRRRFSSHALYDDRGLPV